ncbi:MAG: hypothetical protein KBS52_02525 [Clostridiales bacterium]|nr:hypothetical protein [Candidatus Equinaster intestinalis]
MNNQNDIYSVLKQNGLNADALIKAAKKGDSAALMQALSAADRQKVENLIKSGAADKILKSNSAKDIINRFGEKSNG